MGHGVHSFDLTLSDGGGRLAMLGLKNKSGVQNLQNSAIQGRPFALRGYIFQGVLDFEEGKALF